MKHRKQIMQLTKRMIAIVLVIAMVVELVPQSILAQDSTTAITTEVSELEDGTEKEPDSTENLIPSGRVGSGTQKLE